MTDTPFDSIRFTRNRNPVGGMTDIGSLAAHIGDPGFDVLVAERVGDDPRSGSASYAQAAEIAEGVFRFEVNAPGADFPDGTMLFSAADVAAAFADWAIMRPGWEAEHAWD